jgi:hypothetical protein
MPLVETSWLPLCNGLHGMSILVHFHCLLCVLAHYDCESPESVVTVPPRASIDVGIFAGLRLCDRLILEPIF